MHIVTRFVQRCVKLSWYKGNLQMMETVECKYKKIYKWLPYRQLVSKIAINCTRTIKLYPYVNTVALKYLDCWPGWHGFCIYMYIWSTYQITILKDKSNFVFAFLGVLLYGSGKASVFPDYPITKEFVLGCGILKYTKCLNFV